MSHTYFQNVMHVVFSTKERRKTIPAEMKERLWSYTAGICKRQKVFVHAIGGVEDHIHLLLQFPATIAVADAIRTIKTNSSGWMAKEIGDFAWQEGYGGFGVSKSNVASGNPVHPESGKASPEDDVRRRIHWIVGKAWN